MDECVPNHVQVAWLGVDFAQSRIKSGTRVPILGILEVAPVPSTRKFDKIGPCP